MSEKQHKDDLVEHEAQLAKLRKEIAQLTYKLEQNKREHTQQIERLENEKITVQTALNKSIELNPHRSLDDSIVNKTIESGYNEKNIYKTMYDLPNPSSGNSQNMSTGSRNDKAFEDQQRFQTIHPTSSSRRKFHNTSINSQTSNSSNKV